MNFLFLFLFLMLFMNILSPLLYAYPFLGLIFWIGLLVWILHNNKKRREAFRQAQQQQQQYYNQYSQTSQSGPSRPNVDPKDIIDAEYTEHEIK